MTQPLISVCLPLYNAGRYLDAAVRSVISQTHRNWELILVDDGSTDDTARAAQELVHSLQDSRIRFSANQSRLGMVGNWNHAVGRAKGEFIKLMGQDDLLLPHCLEAQSAVLREHPEVTVVTCARRVVNPDGKPILVRRGLPRDGSYNGPETIRRCLKSGTNMIGEPVSVLFRAETLGTQDLFDPSIVYCTDLDLWLRLLERGDLYFVNEPLTAYRIHPRAATRSLESEVFDDFFRLVDRAVRSGKLQLSTAERLWLGAKVRFLALARAAIYRVLARTTHGDALS